VEEHDPAGQEWFEAAERGLDVQFGKPGDETGTRSVFGRLYRTHAELVERRLNEIARAVCDADPGPIGARRGFAAKTTQNGSAGRGAATVRALPRFDLPIPWL